MYNNSNQDYYQYNQNTQQQYQYQQQQQQQQYYNPQAFDTQDGKAQKMDNNFGYTGDFQDSYIRADFVKKVYTLLTMELLITLGMIALGLYTGMASWLVQIDENYLNVCYYSAYGPMVCSGPFYYINPYPTWLFYVSFFVALIMQCALYCGGNLARKTPVNYIVLLLYIVFFGFTLTTFCILMAIYWGQAIVWQAWGITFIIVCALTLYACKTKTDFSFKIGAIFILSPTILMLVIMLCIWPSWFMYILLCTLFIVIYGFYLIWETQLIMGKGKLKLSIDDYVIGSLLLYATIIQLFLRIIEILAIARGK